MLNFFFGHSKISLELIYENGEVSFYIATYENYVNLVSQHITSIYNDAEIKIIDRDHYVHIGRFRPDVLAFGYDQRSFNDERLESFLKASELSPDIVIIPPFEPERWKSSKMS